MATKAGIVRLLAACAILALPSCSLYLEPEHASTSPTQTRNPAFIQPCSPRLSRTRTGREAVSKNTAEACMMSGRHLGPTIDEIREIRFQEEKQLQAAKFDPRECQENAEDGLVAYSGQDKGPQRRHLGPTLEEVLEIKRLARDRGFPQTDDKEDSTICEADPNSPSQEQIKVLKNYGISNIPSTKAEASLLIREKRDMQIAERFGLSNLNKRLNRPIQREHLQPNEPALEQHDFDHLDMALKGINYIRRKKTEKLL